MRTIVHLGGIARVEDGEKNPQECARVNVGGTRNVIRSPLKGERPWSSHRAAKSTENPTRFRSTKTRPTDRIGLRQVQARVRGDAAPRPARRAGSPHDSEALECLWLGPRPTREGGADLCKAGDLRKQAHHTWREPDDGLYVRRPCSRRSRVLRRASVGSPGRTTTSSPAAPTRYSN